MQSQSGALGIAILERSARIGLGVSSFVSVGNKADVSGNDLLQYWEDDPGTDVVLLYLESFGNPRKFARIARRVSRRKPIVAVKSGRSAAGVRAASSHTAAMASPDIAVDALFRQAGVIRVDTLDELFDMALRAGFPAAAARTPRGHRRQLGRAGDPRHRRLRRRRTRGTRAVGGDAGGAARRGRPERRGVQPRRPGGVRDPRGVRAGARHRARRRSHRCGHRHLHPHVRGPAATHRRRAPTKLHRDATSRCSAASWPGPTSRRCSAENQENQAAPTCPPSRHPSRPPAPWPAPRTTPHGEHGRPARYPTWTASTPTAPAPSSTRSSSARRRAAGCRPTDVDELLAAAGVRTIASATVGNAEEAARAAAQLGFPVALKAAGPELVHKTDVGGVRLGLRSEDEVADAYRSMADHIGERMTGGIIQQMAAPGVETIVGVVDHPLFGPLVMFGMGGIATELLGDRSFRILPVTDLDAAELVRSLRASPLLFGYRGSPPVAVTALEDLLQRIARLAGDVPDLAELDINPLIVSPGGAIAVDARAKVAPVPPGPPPDLRQMP